MESSFNPSRTEDIEDDLEKIRGDAIGDTLFSERFVLSTLLKVANCKNDLTEHENFEQDLCTLWDMTIEHDVVKLLLEHQSLEIFSNLIGTTDDKRLTEILVGIVANMCDYPQTRKDLSENAEIVMPILSIVSCSDTLTLVQLMRFFAAVLVSDPEVDSIVWFEYLQNCENFVQYFSYILMNSMNRELLTGAIEAMTAFCVKFSLAESESDSSVFRNLFVHECLVQGLVEAFKTLSPVNEANHDDDDEDDATTLMVGRIAKLHSNFLDINVMLLQYDDYSRQQFAGVQTEFLKCIGQILKPFCVPSTLFAVSDHELEIFENVREIFEMLTYPFEEECYRRVIEVWRLIREGKKNESDDDKREDDDQQDEVDKNEDTWDEFGKEISRILSELFVQLAKNATEEQLKMTLQSTDAKLVETLLKSAGSESESSDMSDVFKKIENAIAKSEHVDTKK